MAKGKMPPFTMAQYEKSNLDKRMDGKKGAPKEGSKADLKMDKAAMSKMSMGSYKKGGKVKGKGM